MNYKLVNFRGNSDGIIITIKKGSIDDIMSDIEQKINESKEFFKGAKVRQIEAEELEKDSIKRIETLLVDKYNMVLKYEKPIKRIAPKTNRASRSMMMETISQAEEGNESKTKFIESTIRSGQIIEYDGNIVVVGDVNPGGVLSASGNIIVLGALKGIARAGTGGNTNAIVAAFSLEPTQLKIADTISRKPDEEIEESEWPEIARMQDGMIVIDPYLKRNTRK